MRKTTFDGTNSGGLKATMKRIGKGRATVERIAKACNAKVKIGGSTLYLWDRMDRYCAEQADRQAKEAKQAEG